MSGAASRRALPRMCAPCGKSAAAMCFVFELVAASAAGIFVRSQLWVAVAGCMAAELVAAVAYTWTAKIDFGDPDLTPKQRLCEMLWSTSWIGLTAWPFYGFFFLPESTKRGLPLLSAVALVPLFKYGGRQAACLVCSAVFAANMAMAVAETLDNAAFLLWIPLVLMFFLAAFTRYAHDQSILALNGLLLSVAGMTGYIAANTSHRHALMVVPVNMLFIYPLALWRRRRRRLPPGLRGVKFLRLGFLRKHAAAGKSIVRCQDLPPEAFGNPQKASVIIILSHRWLDRFKCDVPTPDHPGGLRLTTMIWKLAEHFSLPQLGKGTGVRGRLQGIQNSLLGGWDVLLFFDFMCLPQIGLDEHGQKILRTEAEEAIFRKVLPHMGALYSFFPVMALEEVVENTHSYWESGWCFSELSIATLGRQLHQYSSHMESRTCTQGEACKIKDSGSVKAFLEAFQKELEEKHFAAEGDRGVVAGLVRGYLSKRLLVDAIAADSHGQFKEVLAGIAHEELQALLEQPVDSRLNTLLHMAVQRRSLPIARELLLRGAQPRLRNLRGDTPAQCQMLPRVSAAARLCRRPPSSWIDDAALSCDTPEAVEVSPKKSHELV